MHDEHSDQEIQRAGELARTAPGDPDTHRGDGITVSAPIPWSLHTPDRDKDRPGKMSGPGLQALLKALREPRPCPPVTLPARPAHDHEIPAGARTVLAAAAAPWTTTALYALGPIPYTWERRAAGYVLAASFRLSLRNPDGRAAVLLWTQDKVTERPGRKPRKGCEGPQAPSTWEMGWRFAEGWRWTVNLRTGRPYDTPLPMGATELRAALLAESADTDALTGSEAA